MWRGYGGNGKEVAIVLDTERTLLDEQSSLFIFSDVHWCTKSVTGIAALLRILAGCAKRRGRIPAVVFDR